MEAHAALIVPCLAYGLALAPLALASDFELALQASIELPGVEGRIDHLALDRAHRRLFVAALGNGSLEVVDLEAKQRLKSVGGLSEPQGVVCVDDLERVLVASGGSGTLDAFDAKSFEKVATLRIGDDADNVRFDRRTRLAYVGFGDGSLSIVDVPSWKVVGGIELGSHPESFQFDAKVERAFVNLPRKREIAVVDLALRKVAERWPVKEAEENFPMAIQGADRRLFIACRKPPRLLVLDPGNGRLFDALELSGDADDVFLDEASGRLYVACGEGTIDVFRREETGTYAPLQKVKTAPGARTCLYSPADDELYVAVPHRGEQRAEIRVYAPKRSKR